MKTAQDEMTRRVAVIGENDNLSDAYAYMTCLEIHHVPVTREGKLVGILSDRDILLHAQARRREASVPNRPVREAMSSDVITCSPSASIGHVADLMLEHKINCLPVVYDDGTLAGIITSTDLIRLLRDREWDMSDRIPLSFDHPVPLLHLAG